MICAQCREEGKTSTLKVKQLGKTLLGCPGEFYDEVGKFHIHDPNSIETHFKCSQGHEWTETLKGFPCPTCGIKYDLL
jgi:hypothetical protein